MASKDDKSSFEILCEMYSNNPDILQCLNNIMVSWEKAQMWENIDVKWEDWQYLVYHQRMNKNAL